MKKKLLAALITVAIAGTCAAGIAACNTKNTPSEPTPPSHSHNWGDGWTVTEANKPDATREGKATRTCTGAGDCDGAKEYTLPNLMSEDYTITNNTATVGNAGTGTYTYNKNGVNVSFTAETPALEPEHSHNWGDGWTVTEENKPDANRPGKATRTCTGAGDCDGAKEYILPVLSKENYTLTNDTATCAAAGTATYTYNKNDVTVSFSADSPVNADNHTYDTSKWLSNGTEHWHAANCGHNEVDNVLNTSDAADHVTGADGYCTVCYTTALTTIQNKFNFVAGNGINFTAFVYGMSGTTYYFTYNGTAAVEVEYGGYSDQGVFSSQTATLADGDSFEFILTGNQDVIYINSDSAEQVTGTLTRPNELGENADGYPVAASKEGVKYTFIGKSTEAGDKFQYVLTCDNANAEIYIDGESEREKITLPYKFKLANNAEKVFYMSYAGNTEISTYNVAVDTEWEEGSIINPKTVEVGGAASVTVPVDDEYYCAFKPTENGWYKVLSTTQNAMLIAGSGKSEEKYGSKGSGFEYYVYIEDASIYEEATADNYFGFRIISLDGAELICNLAVEKVTDATGLALDVAKSGNSFYTYTAADNGPYYNITVSELPASGYWTVVYDSATGKKTIETTLTTLSFNPVKSTVFIVIYGNSTGTVTLEEDSNVTRLSLGKNLKCSGNTEYIFTASEASSYTVDCFKPTNVTKWYYKKQGETAFTTATAQTATIELAAGEQLIIKHSSTAAAGKDVTILLAGTKSLTLSQGSTIATLDKNATQLIHFAGTAEKIYRLVLSNENIVLMDENGEIISGNEFTTDKTGNVFAWLKYVGDGETSGEFTINVEQKIELGENDFLDYVTYYYEVSEAGNYAIDLTLTADYGEIITLNGVETQIMEDATSHSLGYFAEGSVFTLKIESYTDLTFVLRLAD